MVEGELHLRAFSRRTARGSSVIAPGPDMLSRVRLSESGGRKTSSKVASTAGGGELG